MNGVALGTGVAFIVLLGAIGLPVVAILATCSIIGTLISVVGTVTYMGWTLGSFEAIVFSVISGFSVDYVVHIAHAFKHTDPGSWENRACFVRF